MVDCNTLNLTRRGGRKGLAIGSGRGRQGRARHGYLPRGRWVPSYASATVQTGRVARGCGLVYLVPRSSDDGGKYSARCVIAGEPSLAHSRPVVDHQCGNFVVCHFSLLN